MYTLTDVTKTYTGKHMVTALDKVSVHIPDGQMVAIEGPTGGGKSTLLQMLGALDVPTSGSVQLDDIELAHGTENQLQKARAERIGFVFQNFNLVPTLSALENVQTALVPLGVKTDERVQRAREALASVSMADRADHLPDELSGGQQQRIAIARALVKKPRVLLADEPTGNLDSVMRDDILRLLHERWQSEKLTVIMVTHDNRVAASAQRRLRISHGHLQEVSTAQPAISRGLMHHGSMQDESTQDKPVQIEDNAQ